MTIGRMMPTAVLLGALSGSSFGAPLISAQTQGGSATTESTSKPAAANFSNARKLLQLGKYNEAIAELESLRQENPPPAGLAHELGVAYYKKGDYPNAVKNLQEAQREDPKDQEAVQLTGLSLYLAG